MILQTLPPWGIGSKPQNGQGRGISQFPYLGKGLCRMSPGGRPAKPWKRGTRGGPSPDLSLDLSFPGL